MRVPCTVAYVERSTLRGRQRATEVTCDRCGHSTTAYGQHDASKRRCLAALREECPRDESNYYEAN